MASKVQTVLGAIDPSSLGVCLPHEHLLHNLPYCVFQQPLPAALEPAEPDPFRLDVLAYVRQYPYSFKSNLEFSDNSVRDAVRKEMELFRHRGGGTVVDNCSVGLRAPDHLQFLAKLSEATGIHIIAGTGYYVYNSQTKSVLEMSAEEMENAMLKDLHVGVDGIRCGMIGEVGSSWPMHEFERRSITSTASVQDATKCPVIFHPGRDERSPYEMVRIFQEAGGKTSHTVMSHLERTFPNAAALVDFASETDCYCEFDLFGTEVSHYQCASAVDMPSDAQRISLVRALIEEGFADRILISQDIHTKHRLMAYGGHGYSHILLNVIPKMEQRGIHRDNVEKITISNPMSLFSCI